MAAIAGLTYRDGVSDPEGRKAVRRLLFDIFGLDASPLDELGLADPTYRAFAYLDEAGCCVANAAAFSLALVMSGKSVNAMGIQSAATRPEWRRRGLSHDLLERVVRWCDANAPLTFLMTAIPRFYEPMGFTIVPQFAFVGVAPRASSGVSECRRLDLEAAEDRGLLARVLRRRIPVSERFAVDGSAGSFVLNLLGETELCAWYMAREDAVVVTAERSDGTVCIVDIAAATIPALRDVVAAIGHQPAQVEVHFPPDRLGWDGTPIPVRTSTVLMVRGDLAPVGPFMLPATAAF